MARLAPIASVPGLSGLAFRNTVAPGWAGQETDSYPEQTNGDLGYTLTSRRAFLSDYGIDPIDIPTASMGAVEIHWDLGYFTERDARGVLHPPDDPEKPRQWSDLPRVALLNYRGHANRQWMTDLYRAIRQVHPTLPLYCDDQSSRFYGADSYWIGSWEIAERPPLNVDDGGDDAMIATARQRSKLLFLRIGDYPDWLHESDKIPTNYFDHRFPKSPRPPWNGLVIDLPTRSVDDVLHLLTGLPLVDSGDKH